MKSYAIPYHKAVHDRGHTEEKKKDKNNSRVGVLENLPSLQGKNAPHTCIERLIVRACMGILRRDSG